MPPAALKTGFELGIVLDNVSGPQHFYHPGDIITGRVTRASPVVSPRTQVSLRLLGRAKTKIVVTRSNGQSTSRSVHRNRYNFFETTQTRQFLYDGPVHVTSAGLREPLSWPFRLEIPLHPSPQAVRSEGGTSDTSYLSLNPADIASAPLPGSFTAYGHHRNAKFETYVEYHLEADLLDSGSQGKSVTAVLPIHMRARPSMPYPLADFDLQRRVLQGQVTTFHLVPGMENAELSFKQKTKQFMGSRKVPMFGFSLEVECPGTIQLGNPTPIPFTMRVVPNKPRTSEVIHDVPQKVVLKSLELVLKAHTETLAPTMFSTKHTEDTLKHHISLPVAGLGKMINPQTGSSPPAGEAGESSSAGAAAAAVAAHPHVWGTILPSRWEAGKETALDLGTAMDFHLFSTHAAALGQTVARAANGPIYPSFTTYCIRHTAQLKWKAELEIAGQSEKYESQHAVTIIGPSQPNAPPAAVAQPQSEKAGLPPPVYGEDGSGGPSSSSGVGDPAGEELPVYTK